ncbi:uncharacterized protein BP5553_06820 [Venustampulla echinocandica]|uniref:C3H1-type domain-containing protein n=1 Tax=Venustampulla echinocandica TaxID=2656787 RepID=A0A370TL04_9HELO|nr:uncharacterized protein BP5553_06820 [Venustampulla echinocandica]RDL36208.1 hypothetical protein BP5553_06820 [Venustampulla echinocandica]
MAMSANAARALEQVKMGLYMLYGAAYFTEDEWIKIDGLIHKGKYVFTQGPPANFLEDELMSFDHAVEPEPSVKISDSFEFIDKHNTKVSEEALSSTSSKSTDSPSSAETPNEPSPDASSPKEAPLAPPQPEEDIPFNLSSDMTKPPVEERVEERVEEPVEEPIEEPVVESAVESAVEPVAEPVRPAPVSRPSNGGFALGYTQAHVDEIKAFNASLTKAGSKSRPKYTKESYTSPERSEDGEYPSEDNPWPAENTAEEQDYPSSVQTEDDHRIQTWASGVESQGSQPGRTTARNNSAGSRQTLAEPVIALVTQFQETHGRLPKVPNDIYQPNNAQFRTLARRPESRASNRTSKTIKSITKSIAKATTFENVFPPPALNVASGTVLVAQKNDDSSSQLRIQIRAGDHIKVVKHVSGILHYGTNLRTNASGQFPHTIFQKSAKAQEAPNQQNLVEAARRLRGPSVSTTASKDLDSVERINASEWDEVPARRKVATPAPTRPSKGGLANSRFAALVESEESKQDFVHGMTREQVDKIVDAKLQQILNTQKGGITAKTKSSLQTSDDALKSVTPKSATCWFWATPNKGCRFTADECRDLHEILPGSIADSNPANFRSGKPTWGAAGDYVPPTPPTGPSADKSKYTCHFWANGGNCTYPADKCKYLHAWSTAGVAGRPGRSFGGKVIDWNRSARAEKADAIDGWGSSEGWGADTSGGWGASPTTGEAADDEFVLEEVNGSSGTAQGGWDSGADKYKPPHIKALEERALEPSTMW